MVCVFLTIMIKCIICEKELKSLKALSTHIRIHNVTSFEYYESFLKKESDGICKNYEKVKECKKTTSWINIVTGYHKYCSIQCMVKSDEFRKQSSESKKGDKHWLRQLGNVHPNKNKSYDEIYGEQKSKELKENLSTLGKKLIGIKNPFFEHHHSKENCELFRNNKLGKTYDIMYGEEKTKEIKLKLSRPQIKPWKNDENYTIKFFNKSFREEILQDQNYLCACCGTFLYPKRRQIHHINFIKSDDRRENLIYLCPTCHGKTKNRSTYEGMMNFLINRNLIIIENQDRKANIQ